MKIKNVAQPPPIDQLHELKKKTMKLVDFYGFLDNLSSINLFLKLWGVLNCSVAIPGPLVGFIAAETLDQQLLGDNSLPKHTGGTSFVPQKNERCITMVFLSIFRPWQKNRPRCEFGANSRLRCAPSFKYKGGHDLSI